MGGSQRANGSQPFLGQRSRKVGQLVGDIYCRLTLVFWFVPEICAVKCGSHEIGGRKRCFLLPNFFGEGTPKFLGHLQIDITSDLHAKFG